MVFCHVAQIVGEYGEYGAQNVDEYGNQNVSEYVDQNVGKYDDLNVHRLVYKMLVDMVIKKWVAFQLLPPLDFG